jgi:hypothetical protein
MVMETEENVTEFICTNVPVSYRLRKTRSGGIELLGGYLVEEFYSGEQTTGVVEWRVIPTLEVDELP